jgi:hypothetical protein
VVLHDAVWRCRWLLQKGKEEEARKALRTIRHEHEVDREIEQVSFDMLRALSAVILFKIRGESGNVSPDSGLPKSLMKC